MSENNESMVLRITFGARSFLLTGDIEKDAEARLVGSESDLRADVLKVAHHGSKTSSTLGFLEKVNPRHAVISVARPSPFGHPHPEALARLRTTGARIWRTSECGAITISTDGADLRVETFVKCESGE
jgi:competence protein ComEC